jgi:hypothetical protein
MSEFVYLYRIRPEPPVSPQQMQQRMQSWMAWMEDLEKKGHLVTRGHPLAREGGGVVKDAKGSFNDGPYAETKDIVMGFTIVRAADLKEAIQLTTGCPILQGGGGVVEVRPIAQLG